MSLLLLIVNRDGEPGEEEPTAPGVCTFTYDVDPGATYAPDEQYTYDPCADD